MVESVIMYFMFELSRNRIFACVDTRVAWGNDRTRADHSSLWTNRLLA